MWSMHASSEQRTFEAWLCMLRSSLCCCVGWLSGCSSALVTSGPSLHITPTLVCREDTTCLKGFPLARRSITYACAAVASVSAAQGTTGQVSLCVLSAGDLPDAYEIYNKGSGLSFGSFGQPARRVSRRCSYVITCSTTTSTVAVHQDNCQHSNAIYICYKVYRTVRRGVLSCQQLPAWPEEDS
jgi:hypothetical protein